MKTRIFPALVAGLAMLTALPAIAHDPEEFDRLMAAPPKRAPVTCTELQDPYTYNVDLTDAKVKKLKADCDAQAKAEASKAKKKA